MTSVATRLRAGSAMQDPNMPILKLDRTEEEEDKPRHIYRIRKSDYVKLPPIRSRVVEEVCLRHDDHYEDQKHDLHLRRYIHDLVPDPNSRPANLRATVHSPLAKVPDIVPGDVAMWMIANLNRRKAKCLPFSCYQKLGIFNPHPYDLNKDLLEKEVEIKRILEQHRPTLLRSLKKLSRREGGFTATLEVQGKGGACVTASDLDSDLESYPERCSSLRDSALGDSAFGLWEGTNDQDTEYIPSTRTLVTGLTGENDRAILHSLTECGLKQSPSGDTDTETESLKLAEKLSESLFGGSVTSTEGSVDDGTKLKSDAVQSKKGFDFKRWDTVEVEKYTNIVKDEEKPTELLPEKLVDIPSTPKKTVKSSTPKKTLKSSTPKKTIKSSTPKKTIKSATPHEASIPDLAVEEKESVPETLDDGEQNEVDQPTPLITEDTLLENTTYSIKSTTDEEETPIPRAPSNDILGINAMLADLESDKEDGTDELEVEGEGIPVSDEVVVPDPAEADTAETSSPSEPEKSPTPSPVEEETPTPTPPPPPAVRSPTPAPPTPPPPPRTPTPVIPTKLPPPPQLEKKPLPKPPQPRVTVKRLQDDNLIAMRKLEAMERAKIKSREREKQQQMEFEAAAQAEAQLRGDENINQVLERFTIVDKARLNYLYKIFHDSLGEEMEDHLSHQAMKRALSQIKSCTKITRNQLKYVELILELNKNKISFHTFAVMATLIDHMTHKDPSTLAMFDSIDLTRLQHDLPRLKRLFHCVCERDEMGWPKLTTLALDIELRAYCVPENTRNRIIKELDPENRGEITIFDFILFTPLWIHLHDGIVDNPFREIERDISSPLHKKWGVSVLWLPEQQQNAREPRASPASGCGSVVSTPDMFTEDPKMRAVGGAEADYSSEEDEEDTSEGIANSDDENE